jgi:hypothetical protein
VKSKARLVSTLVFSSSYSQSVKQLVVGMNKVDSDTAGYHPSILSRIDTWRFRTRCTIRGDSERDAHGDLERDAHAYSCRVEDGNRHGIQFQSSRSRAGCETTTSSSRRRSDNVKWWSGVDVKAGNGTTIKITLITVLNDFAQPPSRITDAPMP